jgi:hypothetical protein
LGSISYRREQADQRPFRIAKLGDTVAPRHVIGFLDDFYEIPQTSQFGIDVRDQKFQNGRAIGSRLSTALAEKSDRSRPAACDNPAAYDNFGKDGGQPLGCCPVSVS